MTKMFACHLTLDTIKKLKAYCKKYDIKVKKFVEDALLEQLKKSS